MSHKHPPNPPMPTSGPTATDPTTESRQTTTATQTTEEAATTPSTTSITEEPPETDPPGPSRPRKRSPVTGEERSQIVALHRRNHSIRQIAKALGRGRKKIRRVLAQEGLEPSEHAAPPSAESKLSPFTEVIRDKAKAGLTTTRILREIRELGYDGGRTILSQLVRKERSPLRPTRPVKRRFETAPAEEMQVDWSLYTVPIGHRPCRVHCLACVLGYSRKGWVGFYLDERLPTLLEGLEEAFHVFGGVTQRLVFDNPATVVLGRIGRERRPVWNPGFIEFCRHYATEPYLCPVAYPDRKGTVEKFLGYTETDFIRGSSFDNLEDLNRRARTWCNEVANRRVHGTTRLVPDELFKSERDFLIRLPEQRYPVYEESVRQVGVDSTISIKSTLYTVPARLAHRAVAVHLYAGHFEVLDRDGSIAFSRRYVDPRDRGKLQIEPSHYDGVARSAPPEPRRRLDERFLQRFPTLGSWTAGLKERMKTLAPVHLRLLLRLAARYGDQAFLAAVARAHEYRRFNAHAVRRILEREHPLAEDEEPVSPLGPDARARALLSDVEPGSLDGYGHLDRDEPQEDPPTGEPGDARDAAAEDASSSSGAGAQDSPDASRADDREENDDGTQE